MHKSTCVILCTHDKVKVIIKDMLPLSSPRLNEDFSAILTPEP